MKPRKPDTNSPEVETKNKICSKKVVKPEGSKTKKEKDAAAKAEEAEVTIDSRHII